jgi:hypothetical protein
MVDAIRLQKKTQEILSGPVVMAAYPYSNFEVPFSLMSQRPLAQLEDPLQPIMRSLNQPRTPLLEAFFSDINVDVIQNGLRGTVLQRTGYSVDRQSDADLSVIMRRVFGEQANIGASDVSVEVSRLNAMVLDIVVPMVSSGILGYLTYLRDASSLPTPIPRGAQTSVKGTKTFELFRGFAC